LADRRVERSAVIEVDTEESNSHIYLLTHRQQKNNVIRFMTYKYFIRGVRKLESASETSIQYLLRVLRKLDPGSEPIFGLEIQNLTNG
jgi:hypothetical protein